MHQHIAINTVVHKEECHRFTLHTHWPNIHICQETELGAYNSISMMLWKRIPVGICIFILYKNDYCTVTG